MKYLQLKTFGKYDTSDMIDTVVTNAPAGQGFTFADMEKRLTIKKAVKDGVDVGFVSIENADYDHLKSITASFPFIRADEDLFACIKHILEGGSTTKPHVLGEAANDKKQPSKKAG